MTSRTRQTFKGEITDRERDLIDLERDRLEFELTMTNIMAEPDTSERERKIAWLKSMRDTTERDRQIEKIVTARFAEWQRGIAVRVTVYLVLMGVLCIVAALSGVPVFTAKMLWGIIIAAALATLYELWA